MSMISDRTYACCNISLLQLNPILDLPASVPHSDSHSEVFSSVARSSLPILRRHLCRKSRRFGAIFCLCSSSLKRCSGVKTLSLSPAGITSEHRNFNFHRFSPVNLEAIPAKFIRKFCSRSIATKSSHLQNV